MPRSSPRRPSRLGLSLTFGLLAALLAWRWAVPGAPPWLDAALLAAAAVALIAVRRLLWGPGGGSRS